ncbi:MAG TPA: patatin-like phospholipase family protein [Anaerolineae bacterium]|nr:patatin-like phospholipase family protein [Anaerolineae bacterium]
MIGFVLSGGANRGALQVGALQALAAHGITANLVAGTSAGALNGVYYAYDPTSAGLEQLAQKWLDTRKDDVFPGNKLTMAWRVLTGQDSLMSGAHFRHTLERYLPPEARTFRALKMPFYAVTADILSGTTIIFGDEPDTELLEPVLASASFPIVLPPVVIDGFQLTDGGVTAIVPIEVALLRGATELYVIDLEPDIARTQLVHGVLSIAAQTLLTSLREQLIDDLRDAAQAGALVHHVNITAFANLDLFDFSQTAQLIEAGRAAMDRYLDNPKPNTIRPLTPAARPLSARRMPRGGRPLRE